MPDNIETNERYGRVVVPLVGACNLQCVFCSKSIVCHNGGATREAMPELSPWQALKYAGEVLEEYPQLKSICIAGPGEPFADPEYAITAVKLIKKRFPAMNVSVITNGIEAFNYCDQLVAAGLDNLTVTINSLNRGIITRLYDWVRFEKRLYRGEQAAEIIRDNQIKTVRQFAYSGIDVKVNTIYLPGINDIDIVAIARKSAQIGAKSFACIRTVQDPDTGENVSHPVSERELDAVRKQCSKYIEISGDSNCRCGTFGNAIFMKTKKRLFEIAAGPIDPEHKRPNIAVATLDSVTVNRHLGQAGKLNIYSYKDGICELLDVRDTPPAGGGEQRWMDMAAMLSDCSVLFVKDAGLTPLGILKASGLSVIRTEETISNAIKYYLFPETMTKCSSCSVMGCDFNKKVQEI